VMAFVAVFLVVYGATVYAVSSGLFKQWWEDMAANKIEKSDWDAIMQKLDTLNMIHKS
jgi:hypothetical protein